MTDISRITTVSVLPTPAPVPVTLPKPVTLDAIRKIIREELSANAALEAAARQALEALRFYADCRHQVTLTGFKNGSRIGWDQERDRLEKAGYRFSHESYNSTEEYVEDGRRAQGALNNLEEALAQHSPATLIDPRGSLGEPVV